MTNIVFHRNDKGKINKINMQGHSGYANSGNDIVCSSISTLVYNLLFGLIEILEYEQGVDFDYDMKGGYFYLDIINNKLVNKAYLLTETMFLTIKTISENYSDNIRWEEIKCY